MKFNLFDLLLPRETKFYTMLSLQAQNLLDTCRAFKELAGNADGKIPEDLMRRLAMIKEFEKKGDAIERQILDELDKTFITPIDREDIHHITTAIDRAVDMINNLAKKFNIYGIAEVPVHVRTQCDIVCDISAELLNLMNSLKTREGVSEIIRIMHELEKRSDDIFSNAMAELFKKSNDAVAIIKIKEVHELLEEIVDTVDYVGKIVRCILVKVS